MPPASNKQKEQDLIHFNKSWDLRSVTRQMLFLKPKVFVMIVTVETKLCKIFQTSTSLLPWAVTTVLCTKAASHGKFSTRTFSLWLFAFNSNHKTGFPWVLEETVSQYQPSIKWHTVYSFSTKLLSLSFPPSCGQPLKSVFPHSATVKNRNPLLIPVVRSAAQNQQWLLNASPRLFSN